jgi:enamine deaminase RidA (YjgF/YER057c/UK114 family)
MPKAQYITPETLSRSRGYSQVVKVGNTVYIAGQVSVGADGNVVGKGDADAQVRQVWRNIETAVKAAGGTLQNVVKTTTYVTHIQYAAAVRKVRDELFQSSNPPTSTLLVVAGLASPDYVVEIESIAVVD